MGEIVSGVATTILERLATKAYQEIALACGLKGDVKRFQDYVRIISAFLMDAENKQAQNQSIAEWLKQLKDAFDDADDILDEIEYEAKRNEVFKLYGSASRKVCRFFSCSNPLAFRIKMAHRIKDIKQRIDDITITGRNLGLVEQHESLTTRTQNLLSRETSSFEPPRVTGREVQKEELISLLTCPPTSSQSQVSDLDVIPIVGVGGLGKTTLAQMVYNNNGIKEHFDKLMWVCVSDDFDVKGLILKIIQAADRNERRFDHNSILDQLLRLLHEKLHGKRFLLVLDDVWNDDPKKWDDLRGHLLGVSGEMNSNRSKIIVTTRNHTVASIMGTGPQINLEPLPEKECWELFVKCAFQGEEKEVEQYTRLKEIGKEIVKKCKGVPLALITLGCLLKSKKHDENEWKKVRDSELWKVDEKDDGILPSLRLSYNHLPSQLKRCFSYCSIFPKDYEYRQTLLIAFWMAHGLLQPTDEKEEMEDLGELYLSELVSACLLQVDIQDKDSHEYIADDLMGLREFKMHDLVHDLAMSTLMSERERHVQIQDAVYSRFPKEFNKIRTLGCWEGVTPSSNVIELFPKFKYVRVLGPEELDCGLLPDDCLANMKHLRYLNLSATEKLPDSICKLQLLQTLSIKVEGHHGFPKNMRYLTSLRLLGITTELKHLSSTDIGCFRFLQLLGIEFCHN